MPENSQHTQRTPGRPPLDGETRTGHIHIRTGMARKRAYVRAARPQKLTEWIFRHLDKAAGYTDGANPP